MTVNCCIIHSERAGAARKGMRDSPAEDEARTEERQELRTTNDLLIEILTPRRRRRSRARAGQTELNLNYSAEYSSLGTPERTAVDGRGERHNSDEPGFTLFNSDSLNPPRLRQKFYNFFKQGLSAAGNETRCHVRAEGRISMAGHKIQF